MGRRESKREGETMIHRWIILAAVLFAGQTLLHGAWSEVHSATGADVMDHDNFGAVLATFGDTVVVGSPYDGDPHGEFGSAYVFQWNGASLVEQVKLSALVQGDGDRFGTALSHYPDHIVIGAPGDNYAWTVSYGAVYDFRRAGGAWVQDARLVPSDSYNNDRFGRAVAVSGDYMAVGGGGAAYVFPRQAGSWTEAARITASDAGGREYFGISIGLDGDYMVVGAHLEPEGGGSTKAGAAYVFHRENGSWVEQAKLTAANRMAGDRFGTSVAIQGDRIVVGAPYDDDVDKNAGTVHVFRRNESAWGLEAILTPFDDGSSDHDRFGGSIAFDGERMLVGAFGNSDGIGSSGAGYLFRLQADTWEQVAKLKPSTPFDNDSAGSAVALGADWYVLGAPGGSPHYRPGSVYVFVPEPATLALVTLGGLALIRRRG